MTDEAIGREIRQLRADLKEDFAEIKSQLAGLLPREVYSARHDALVRRVEALEREVERAESERVAARRWLISALVVPLVSICVMIILALA